jgi:hypothetical protein
VDHQLPLAPPVVSTQAVKRAAFAKPLLVREVAAKPMTALPLPLVRTLASVSPNAKLKTARATSARSTTVLHALLTPVACKPTHAP